jgi:hypothetical protein
MALLLLSAVLVLVWLRGPGCAPRPYLAGDSVSRASGDSMVGVVNAVDITIETESTFHFPTDSSSPSHHPHQNQTTNS